MTIPKRQDTTNLTIVVVEDIAESSTAYRRYVPDQNMADIKVAATA